MLLEYDSNFIKMQTIPKEYIINMCTSCSMLNLMNFGIGKLCTNSFGGGKQLLLGDYFQLQSEVILVIVIYRILSI
jgi:hypothetical protein